MTMTTFLILDPLLNALLNNNRRLIKDCGNVCDHMTPTLRPLKTGGILVRRRRTERSKTEHFAMKIVITKTKKRRAKMK
jgi:hypothetical protein